MFEEDAVAITTEPEIIRPGASPRGAQSRRGRPGSDLFADENLDALSHLLDDFIHVPGTRFRLGLDGIVGFIPGIGDVIGGIASSIIIIAAWSRGVAAVTVARMVMTVAIETIGGALPIVGNLFDIGWKANRRNYKLLTGSIAQPRRTASQSWLVLGVICLVLAGLMLLPTLLLGWLLIHMGHMLHAMSGPR
jgi:hypothetical protein